MKSFLTSAAGLAIAAALAAAPAMASDNTMSATLVAKADGEGDAAVKGDASLKALTFGTWGVDLAARDTNVKPGDDFDRYANGGWFARTEIPADQASAGVDYDVYNLTQRQLGQLVTGAPATSQVGGLYQSFMDEKRVDALGARPLMADVDAVAAIKDKSAMARFMGSTQGTFGATIVSGGPYADTNDPTVNVLWLGQAGLGLPERDYYLNDSFKTQRDAYRAYIVRTMKMVGNGAPEKAADAIMAFETEIAKVSWAIADRRDIGKINNPMSSDELAAFAPGLDWKAWLEGAGIGPQKRIIVNENTAVRDIAALYARTPLDTIKLWQQFHIADNAAPYLSKAFVDSRFEYTKVLSGVGELRPRWKRGLTLVDGSLGELVGETYARQYFPASAKAKMEALVANLKLAMGDRIRSNSWMAPETKAAALDKLAKMDVMVGYPDKWRDYSGLKIDPTDLYGNVKRSAAFEYAYSLSDLNKPVDRKKWSMNPQEVNAYNGGLENKIVFPAGILQAPYFSESVDDAVNYGAIGAVIGHEISHGFDDQGRKIDANGAVRDWWTAADAARFEAQAKAFGAQYATFEAAPGAFINPDLTMGENIADLAGLEIAYDAYHRSLGGKEAPVIDGLTGDQRFFLAFAQAWRDKAREDSIKQQVASDEHAPARWRIIGPVRNVDAWYKAFNVTPDNKYYLKPEARTRIW
ncbi:MULTISPECIES: M13 family metallopeptidase [unclassified Sphingopyxis]|uniref:M13 family metallopeptidase n=1 Tax=unclassified Sphingopyxis TaxID=2614943 RepID=UPI000731C8F6|nr:MULTISPECIES: M13 family metallopeptidase [unclassified Sphingopyxis]KTE24399.1 peptidase M13 [Sphingopyxis sp. H057]KTE50927.1 peptidase M13 [Sphingopyxis sp. H071]KTE52070.1 peptidase M13 [Sphingopyxis sp. H073]KTE59651.1 peptidase M13 [Sphingopyxis sp. H107]KTE62270.1 peptidase M13 [Sphingopyxis sp. H100]